MSGADGVGALLFDVGNTHVRAAAWPNADGGRLHVLGKWTTPAVEEEKNFKRDLEELCAVHPSRFTVVTSVVPRLVSLLREVWPGIRAIDHTCDLPFSHELPTPESIGPDRLCNMAAASVKGRGNVLVVDAGTATTFDLLVDNIFIGGLIAPGMATAAQSLADRTARLAAVEFEPCPFAVGQDTKSAMRAGIYHVAVGGVESVVDRLRTEYGPLEVVTTGGLAAFLPEQIGRHDPDWTFQGAAVLAGL